VCVCVCVCVRVRVCVRARDFMGVRVRHPFLTPFCFFSKLSLIIDIWSIHCVPTTNLLIACSSLESNFSTHTSTHSYFVSPTLVNKDGSLCSETAEVVLDVGLALNTRCLVLSLCFDLGISK